MPTTPTLELDSAGRRLVWPLYVNPSDFPPIQQTASMVFFSCDGCGECLKKNQVDGHAARCRRCDSVSCADCQVSFYGDDYRGHTSCLTEVERYETKGKTTGKPKKVTPQEMWSGLIQDSVANAPSDILPFLRQISNLDNVPRKEKQFRNFCANSLKLRGKQGDDVLTSVWNYLQEIRAKQMKEKAAQQAIDKATPAVDKQTEEPKPMSSPAIEKTDTKDQKSSLISAAVDAKSVKKAMKRVLKKAQNHKLSTKRLRKQVQASLNAKDKKALKKLIGATLTNKQFAVDGDSVQLLLD